MCLKLSNIANRIPLASLLPYSDITIRYEQSAEENTNITGHEDRPEQDTEHETVVLEMYVVDDQKAGMKKQ